MAAWVAATSCEAACARAGASASVTTTHNVSGVRIEGVKQPGQASRHRISAPLAQFGAMTETRHITGTTDHTPIKTPFGFESTAAEVIAGIDLSGKRTIVTGGSSGIGVETARALASAGAEVTLAVRDTDAGQRTAAGITESTHTDSVHVDRLDLADPASVAAFVAAWEGPLHTLVN